MSAFEPYVSRDQWDNMPARVEQNMYSVLELLAKYEVQATFYVLGWIAERYPQLIRLVVDTGHELGSHGFSHVRAVNQDRKAFFSDVQRTKALLEDVGGHEVKGYRAASFSIGRGNLWALEVLKEAGYEYSSSIYPIRHDLYGMEEAPRFPFRWSEASVTEIPISTVALFGRNWPCGGGGYFRLLPYRLSRWAIQRVNDKDDHPTIFYFHPWEIDPEQPRLRGIGLRARFRHYQSLDRMEGRLHRLLQDFRWNRVDQVFPELAMATIGPNTTPEGISLGGPVKEAPTHDRPSTQRPVAVPEGAPSRSRAASPVVPAGRLLVGVGMVLLAGAVINWDTTSSLFAKWWTSAQYQHSFLVLPLSVYLAWQNRGKLAGVSVRSSPTALFFLALIALGWWAAYVVDVRVVQWLAWFAVIPVVLWALLGLTSVRVLAFPLGYLLLAVPVWAALSVILQPITTAATVAMLRLTGIPVATDANYIWIPEGTFLIAEFCAGLHFLLAGTAIGVLFAYWHAESKPRRLLLTGLFVLASMALNWVRVYLVIVVGHLTSMQSSLVHDHGSFGWAVFAIGMIPVWFLAIRLSGPHLDKRPPIGASGAESVYGATGLRSAVVAAVLALLAAPPLAAYVLKASPPLSEVPAIDLPNSAGSWGQLNNTGSGNVGTVFRGASQVAEAQYRSEARSVHLYVAAYVKQRQGAEAVSDDNRLYDHHRWQNVGSEIRQVHVGGGSQAEVQELRLRQYGNRGTGRLVWVVFQVGGRTTGRRGWAKVLQFWGTATGHPGAAAVVISTEARADLDRARETLSDFLAVMAPELRTAVEQVLEIRTQTVGDGPRDTNERG